MKITITIVDSEEENFLQNPLSSTLFYLRGQYPDAKISVLAEDEDLTGHWKDSLRYFSGGPNAKHSGVITTEVKNVEAIKANIADRSQDPFAFETLKAEAVLAFLKRVYRKDGMVPGEDEFSAKYNFLKCIFPESHTDLPHEEAISIIKKAMPEWSK